MGQSVKAEMGEEDKGKIYCTDMLYWVTSTEKVNLEGCKLKNYSQEFFLPLKNPRATCQTTNLSYWV